jgi:hypothetical protein
MRRGCILKNGISRSPNLNRRRAPVPERTVRRPDRPARHACQTPTIQMLLAYFHSLRVDEPRWREIRRHHPGSQAMH